MTRNVISPLENYKVLSQSYERDTLDGLYSDPFMVFNAVAAYLKPDMSEVLDVGIGTGLSSLPFKERGMSITGIDGSPEMLVQCAAKNRAKSLLQLDFDEAAALPLPDNHFDVTISHATLYMVWESQNLLENMMRVTKPGGLIAFNYEPAPYATFEVRENMALIRDEKGNPQTVQTFAIPDDEVKTLFSRQKMTNLYAKTAPAMRKFDGTVISFETLVYQKPFSL